MPTPAKPSSAKGLSRDKIKLLVALGLFALAGVILGWQLLGGGKRTDPEIDAQQRAIMEQVGGSNEPAPAPAPTPPTQPEQHGRGPRSVKGK